MTDPIGQLDQRFSDPSAKPMEWATVRELMEQAMTYPLCTVRRSNRPHATPLAGVWHQDLFYFCTGADEQKARNLESNPGSW